jgi:dipeptidyl aminopeptidase/acylaminoacyl peptidase
MKSKADLLLGTISVSPFFFNDSDKFFYAYRTGDSTIYYLVDPETKTKRELFSSEWFFAKMSKLTGKNISERMRFSMKNPKRDNRTFIIRYEKYEIEFDLEVKTLKKLRDDLPDRFNSSNDFTNISPDSAYGIYLEKYNLYLKNRKTAEITQLTEDGEEYYTYAGSEFLGMRFDNIAYKAPARGEWLKDSKHFYILREDVRKVGFLPIIDALSGRPKVKQNKYIPAGDEFVIQSELWIFNAETKEKKRINIDKWKDQIVKLIPSGRAGNPETSIFFTREKRSRDEIELCRVDPTTGEVTVLINEVGKPYLADEFFSVNILNGGKDIIWWSERTGWGHYYLYNEKGELVNAITSGEWVAGKILKIETEKRILYFEGYGQVKGEAPYFSRLNKAKFESKGKTTLLTPEPATHEIVFSPSMKYIIDNYSRADLEPVTVLRDMKGTVLMEVARPNLIRLYETGWKMPEAFTAKAADGTTDLYGYLWKPYNFDPNRTYPIISYAYPGPQTDHLPLTFSVSGRYNAALAQLGFVVVTFGHRGGVPIREKAYHSYGYNNIRDYPLADDKIVLEQLAGCHSFIDLSKVGIFGHSGGGFMSAAALLTYPDFYKVAVAASGNHDNSLYYKSFVELYNGVEEKIVPIKKKIKSPETGRDTTIMEDKTIFESRVATTMELAKNLKGHLMLVTGDADNNVHPANTFRLANALISAGKNFDLVILPGEGHVYSGKNNDFFERKLWLYFAKHLLDDYENEKITDFASMIGIEQGK